MTLVPRWWPRQGLLERVPSEDRTFWVTADTQILTKCNWQFTPQQAPTLILVHGLEGCTESHYMLGIAHKAWHAGNNVVRINQRNCGGTEHLTPTLYNAGLSKDIHAVVMELVSRDELQAIWLAGYSMGGNLVLRMAGEAGNTLPQLKGAIAVCPNIHPAACVEALQKPKNLIYHNYFLFRLKARLQRKTRFFPNKFDLSKLSTIRTMWEFDDVFTAPDDGYTDAADYYERSGARHVMGNICIPTLILTAQDDPFIPYHTFNIDSIHHNPFITLLAPHYGGHCGFLQHPRRNEDLYWAENRIIEFLLSHQ